MPWRRWIVVFFTRPMSWADLARMWRASRKPTPTQAGKDIRDFEPTRLIDRPGDVDSWGRSRQLEVSEEPFETLPAALQDEFAPSKTGKDGQTPD